MTLSGSKIFNDTERRATFATAALLLGSAW